MPQTKQKKTKKKETRIRTRLIGPGEDMPEEDKMDEHESGMFLEKEGVRLIYHALHEYTPTPEEEVLHSALLEEFEEMLVVDYDDIPPDVN